MKNLEKLEALREATGMNEFDWELIPVNETDVLEGLDLMQDLLSEDEAWAQHIFRNQHPEEW